MIESIQPITQLGIESTTATAASPSTSFAEFMKTEIVSAENKIDAAENQLQALALGETDNLHQVMTAITKAQTAFDFVVEVRNKLLEAYQEISKMQV